MASARDDYAAAGGASGDNELDELTEAQVEQAAEEAWAATANGQGQLSRKARPLTYSPNKAAPKDKKAKAKARLKAAKRPSDLLAASSSDSAASAPANPQYTAARRQERAYTQNVQHAMHPMQRAAADYNSIANMGSTHGDATAAVLAGAPASLDFDPYSEDDIVKTDTSFDDSNAYPPDDSDSFTPITIELKHSYRLDPEAIAAATAAAAAKAVEIEKAQQAREEERRLQQEQAEAAAAAEGEIAGAGAVGADSDSAFDSDSETETEDEATAEVDTEAIIAAAEKAGAASQARQAQLAAAAAAGMVNEFGLPLDDRIGPVGSLTFPDVRQYDLVYVNKLLALSEVLNYGQVILVRPHGFGTTFLLSTIECILGGYRQFVAGLKDASWLQSILVNPVPVVRLDLSQFLIKVSYDPPAYQAYLDFKNAEHMANHERTVTDEELALRQKFEANEEVLLQGREVLWKLRAAYQEIHDRLDELNRLCAMQQSVLERSFRHGGRQSLSENAALEAAETSSDDMQTATGSQRQGGNLSFTLPAEQYYNSDLAQYDGHSQDEDEGEELSAAEANKRAQQEVSVELHFPQLSDEFPLTSEAEEVVVPRAARPLVEALSLCEEALRVLQGQQQSVGLQIDLYLAKEYWIRCQSQLDQAREHDEKRRQQLQVAMDATGDDEMYAEARSHFAELGETIELKKARERTAMAHQRVVAVSSHLEAIRDVNALSDNRPLKQLQSKVNTLRQRERSGRNANKRMPVNIPAEVRPLMEEIDSLARLLRELQREWGRKRAEYGRMQKQQGGVLAELKRIEHEQELQMQQSELSSEELMAALEAAQWHWEQERDRLLSELATAYYQQFYLALAQPTLPHQSEAVAAAYAATHADAASVDVPTQEDIVNHASDALISAFNAQAARHVPVSSGMAATQAYASTASSGAPHPDASDFTAAGEMDGSGELGENGELGESSDIEKPMLTPEQESEIVANTEVTLFNFEGLLTALIKEHAGRIKPCALLLDQYDAALTGLDDCPDMVPLLQELLDKMITSIRASQELFKHIFFVGTTDFSSSRAFFGFERLVDISQLNTDVAAIVGYTEEELREYFAPELEAAVARIEQQRQLARNNQYYHYSLELLLDEMREHYGNYSFAPNSPIVLFNTKQVLAFLQDRSNEQHLFKSYLDEEGQ